MVEEKMENKEEKETKKVEQETGKPKTEAPKGVPPAQKASAEADKVGKSNKDKRSESESKSPKEQDKKETKKPAKKVEIKAKEFAVARGQSLRVSGKHCFAICKMIKDKTPERAIEILEEIVKLKKPVPMPGREVPHQKGKGIAGAKFPKKAAGEIIPVVKQLDANAIVNGVENPVIVIAKADKAPAPFRRGGRRGKRTHIYLEARDRTKLVKKKGKKAKKKSKKMKGANK